MKKLIWLCITIILINCKADLDILQEVVLEPSPSKVTLIFPENNEECTAGVIISNTESEVLFEWTEAEIENNGYELLLVNLTTQEESIFNSETNSLLITLLRGTPYSWKVITLTNNSTNTETSDTEFFYNAGPGVEFFVPFPATNITPLNNSIFPTDTAFISLEWQAEDLDNDISNYDIYFDTVTPPTLYETSLETTNLNNIQVESGTEYFWKVVTKDVQGNISTSNIFSFKID